MPDGIADVSPDFARCWASLFAGSDELVVAIDARRRILAVSDGFTRRFGTSEAGVLGHMCADVAHEGGEIPGHCPFHELLLDGRQHQAEVHSELLGGDFLVRVTPVLDEEGELECAVHTLVDVTERRRTEEELRASEERYRLLAEHVSDVVFQGEDGGLTWISPSITALSGWLPEQLLNRPLAEFVHPDDLPRLAAARQGSTGDVAGRCEVRMRFADGTWHWLSLVLETIAGGDGMPILVGSARDVQEQVAAREALAESERHYRVLSESSPDFIFVFGRDLRVRYVNQASADALRKTPEDVVGATAEELFEAGTAAEMALGLRAVFDSGEARHAESAWPGPWGQRWLTTWILPIMGGDGTVKEVFGVSRDITDMKRAESELATLNDELEERVETRTAELNAVNEELEAFAYAVSHDLRAPLRAIDGFSQLLMDDHAEQLSDSARADLQRVRAAAQKMGQLIDALLVLSRLTRRELDLGRVDLSRLAVEILAGLIEQDPGRVVEVGIEPDCRVTGDARLLQVVLANLLGNAWKFTRPCADARIDFGEAALDGERVFYVRDNGVGFDPAYTGKLFQPFQRLHAGEEFPGTGIGLATVRRIMARLGGRTWAEGEPERGATFYFTLPEPAEA